MNRNKAIIFSLIASVSLAYMTFFAKKASLEESVLTIMLWRFIFAAVLSTTTQGINAVVDNLGTIRDSNIKLHAIRSSSTLLSMGALYAALIGISATDATILNLTHPFFLIIICSIFLKSKIKIKEVLYIGIGFIGVYVLLSPNLSGGPWKYYLLALASGLFTAVSYASVRGLSEKSTPEFLLFFNSLISSVVCFIICLIFKIPILPSGLYSAIPLLLSAFFGAIYQDFIIRAIGIAKPTIPSSLMYTSIIFSMIISSGFISLTNTSSAIGVPLIAIGGILISTRKIGNELNNLHSKIQK